MTRPPIPKDLIDKYPGLDTYIDLTFPETTTNYKGFLIKRPAQQHLYEIAPKEGFSLPNGIAGRFTRLETLQKAIDYYFERFPDYPITFCGDAFKYTCSQSRPTLS
jgi:hypothetical protein